MRHPLSSDSLPPRIKSSLAGRGHYNEADLQMPVTIFGNLVCEDLLKCFEVGRELRQTQGGKNNSMKT